MVDGDEKVGWVLVILVEMKRERLKCSVCSRWLARVQLDQNKCLALWSFAEAVLNLYEGEVKCHHGHIQRISGKRNLRMHSIGEIR
jgi:hypothetical protein